MIFFYIELYKNSGYILAFIVFFRMYIYVCISWTNSDKCLKDCSLLANTVLEIMDLVLTEFLKFSSPNLANKSVFPLFLKIRHWFKRSMFWRFYSMEITHENLWFYARKMQLACVEEEKNNNDISKIGSRAAILPPKIFWHK